MANYALSNTIYIGDTANPSYTFTNRNIAMNTLRSVNTVDVVGNELSVDTFSFTVRYNPLAALIYAPVGKDGYLDVNNAIYMLRSGGRTAAKDYLRDVAYGSPVWWYVGSSLFFKGYIKSIERIAKTLWKVSCQSGVGLLDEVMHTGGMYEGVKFSVIFSSIVGDAFGYVINNSVKNLLVYQHLPYDTARNNLHRLLFALGVALIRRSDGDYQVAFLPQSTTAVPDSRIALGGSVAVQSASNQAEVTEHAYEALQTDPEETLFDNTSGTGNVDHALIVFSEPMHDLVGSGITVHESNCNYAVISGTGTLTGKKYTHIEKIITMTNAAVGDAIRAKRVTDNHLISAANSLNVARRVLSYYSSARTLKAKILLNNERCGQNLSLNDAFGDPTTAYLKKTDVLVTSVRGASCELIEGYVPTWNGNNYTQRQIITASGAVTIPAGAKRLILIGGGDGGTGGYDGERGRGGVNGMGSVGDLAHIDDPWGQGDDSEAYYYNGGDQPIAQGGAAGEPGASGKIYVVDLEDSGTSATVVIGQGGTGGVRNGGAGSAGGATTITIDGTTYTSADGATSAAGFIDALGNATYALPGADGYKGGNGGRTNVQSLYGWENANGLAGESVAGYPGGAGGQGVIYDYGFGVHTQASGGGGGGAAYGAAGKNTHSGASITPYFYGGTNHSISLANGGDGADAVAPSQPTYGNGGTGGNGGGGGGNAGGGFRSRYSVAISLTVNRADAGGAPGKGSVGGQGGNGCVIIYY